jgi:hypothetical protein
LATEASWRFPRLKRLKVERFKVDTEEIKALVAAFESLGIKTRIM